ncbi:MAG TPA: hypothetical protein VFB52_07035 [Solirubrobacterales bacterium]|nr:hypothetical protein [Solirubrobacterales bacterium]
MHGKLRLSLLAALCLLGVSVIVASATAETATVGNIKFTADGGFSPKALPKKTFAPIALTAKGKIETKDGTHPPALKEVLLETDKNGAIDVKGYPACTSGKLQSQTTANAEKACKGTLIGTGKTTVEIELADQPPIDAKSKLLVVNGGVKGGVTTLFIHAYLTQPVPAAVVTTVKIKKINKGRYGTLSVASIPVIASGAGSVTDFELTVDKKFTYKGKQKSVLTAKCPDGKLQANATAIFRDGTRVSQDFVRPCTGKG